MSPTPILYRQYRKLTERVQRWHMILYIIRNVCWTNAFLQSHLTSTFLIMNPPSSTLKMKRSFFWEIRCHMKREKIPFCKNYRSHDTWKTTEHTQQWQIITYHTLCMLSKYIFPQWSDIMNFQKLKPSYFTYKKNAFFNKRWRHTILEVFSA